MLVDWNCHLLFHQANSAACIGKYESSGDKGAAAGESLYVANHAY